MSKTSQVYPHLYIYLIICTPPLVFFIFRPLYISYFELTVQTFVSNEGINSKMFLLIKVFAFIKVTFFLIHSVFPTHLFTALHETSDFGGASAEAIKKTIDSIFTEENFLKKLVATTTDGASVNFGCKEGLLKRLINEGSPWMIKFHCTNHRIKLLKDVLKDSAFSEVDKQYLAIFNLMKNSGAVKSDVKFAAKALDISCYTLPKITETHFVSHRKKAYTRLLNMWPALITAFENTLAYHKIKAETKAKISSLLKVLQNYEYVMLTCAYADILKKIMPLSLVYEKDHLLVTR